MAGKALRVADGIQSDVEVADGWHMYRDAIELLAKAKWSPALDRLAEAETIFRTYDDLQGVWRTLLGQMLAHSQVGATVQALARGLAATRAATSIDDRFAIGCIAWQMASLAIAQGDFRAGASSLEQAEQELAAAGVAPAGGMIMAAAQLCTELARWHAAGETGLIARRAAETMMREVLQELSSRLDAAAEVLRATCSSAGRPDRSDAVFLLTAPLAHPNTPAPPASLRARLMDWWQRFAGGVAPPPDEQPPPAPAIALSPSRPDHIDAESLSEPAEQPARTDRDGTADAAAVPALSPSERGAGLAIYCFGNFRVYLDDMPVEQWDGTRARTILKYLVTQPAATAPKEVLADLFWPTASPALARRNLHQTIYCLRQSFKRLAPDTQVIQFAAGCYQINPAIDLWVDSQEFDQAIAQARTCRTRNDPAQAMHSYALAIDLYGGEFLIEDRYEPWAEDLRRAYQAMFLEALHHLSQHHFDRGELATTIMLCQRGLAHESCDEEAHRLLIGCYLAQGLRHLAVRQYQICADALKLELDLAPSDELEELYRSIVGTG